MLLSITYLFVTRGKNLKKQYENNKLKIIAPMWNDEFELPDGSFSVSGIKDQKQPCRGVLRKRCSENMQQIYRRTPMPMCDFN